MNLEALSIEDLAAFRDRVNAALSDKVAARQKELLVESGKGSGPWSRQPSTARPKDVLEPGIPGTYKRSDYPS